MVQIMGRKSVERFRRLLQARHRGLRQRGIRQTRAWGSVEKVIGQVLTISSDDAQQDRGQQQGDQAQAEPASIEKGMSPDDVEAAMGKPEKKVTLGAKQILLQGYESDFPERRGFRRAVSGSLAGSVYGSQNPQTASPSPKAEQDHPTGPSSELKLPRSNEAVWNFHPGHVLACEVQRSSPRRPYESP
jgi:hypothetical protein